MKIPVSTARNAIRATAYTTMGKLAIAAIAATATSSLAAPAWAFTFSSQPGVTAGNPGGQPLYQVELTPSDIGDSFTLNWLLPGSGNRAELAATAEVTVVDFTSSTLILDVTLTNATTSDFQAAIMSLGLGVNTTLTNVALSSAGATFNSITPNPNQNFPGGFSGINVCIYAANTCSGGAIFNGLQSGGNSDTVQVTLTGNFASSLTIAAFPIKFQTEAGSYELAGNFEEMAVVVEEEIEEEIVEEEEDTEEIITEETETEAVITEEETETTVTTEETETVEFTQTVSQVILQQISQQLSVSSSELRILQVTQQTWSDGCLGLGAPGTACTQALVPGYRVKVASRENVYVYRTNASGSLVVFDQTQTSQVRASRTYRRQVRLSRSVHQSVLRTISQTYQVSESDLRVVRVNRKQWRNDCLGVPAGPGRGRACGRGRVPGYMVVVSDGTQSWVCRTTRNGSYVVVDERATQFRRAQKAARGRQQVFSYTDVSRTYWAWEYIQELSTLDIIAGYPDGLYRPDQVVNRAEFAAIVSRAFEYAQVREAVNFSDVPENYWGFNAARAAYRFGFLDTVNGNLFQPQRGLTRGAAMMAIARGLELPNLTPSAAQAVLANYSGTVASSEMQQTLASLIQSGIFVGYPNPNQLNLDQEITRAEVAVLVYQALASLGGVESIASDFTGDTVAEDEIEIVDEDELDDFDDLEAIEPE
jgi:hypothetical protein